MPNSKKNLLNESQIRQFMKLAKLEPLTPGFVTGLTETSNDDIGESHDRGKGENPPHARLREADEEDELDATEDELGDMDAEFLVGAEDLFQIAVMKHWEPQRQRDSAVVPIPIRRGCRYGRCL